MKTILLIAAGALASGWAVHAAVQSPAERNAARVAEILDGRVAGEPMACVRTRDLRGNRPMENGDILFNGRGSTAYVNQPSGGCPELRDTRTLVTSTPSTQLCRGDIARVVDLTTRGDYGSCVLGDFIPYRRAS